MKTLIELDSPRQNNASAQAVAAGGNHSDLAIGSIGAPAESQDGDGSPPGLWQVLDDFRDITAMIARQAPAHEIFQRVAEIAEATTAPSACSIRLLRNRRLYHLAAPSLPASFCTALDGIEIGPLVGSCGAAAWSRKPVAVRDIAEDGRWNDFRDLALAAGHRACWSLPILDEEGGVQGTLAVYLPTPREPDDADWHRLQALAALTYLAIVQDRQRNSLHWVRQALHAGDQRLHLQNIELDETRERLKRQTQEIEYQAQALLAARGEALAGERAQAEFLANISHELRTPLGAVIGFSDLMLCNLNATPDTVGDEKHGAYLRDINDSGRHLLKLIDDILDQSHIDAGRMSLVESRFDLHLMLSNLMRKARSRMAGNALTVDFGAELPFLWADQLKLSQALQHLIFNAIKFTPPGGRIQLGAKLTAAGEVTFTIEDNGIGMTPEEVSLALQPFRQIESAYCRKHHGLGLGLPLAKSVIELHGGTLAIESQPQVGTKVIVTLPAERSIAPESAVEKESHP